MQNRNAQCQGQVKSQGQKKYCWMFTKNLTQGVWNLL